MAARRWTPQTPYAIFFEQEREKDREMKLADAGPRWHALKAAAADGDPIAIKRIADLNAEARKASSIFEGERAKAEGGYAHSQ